MMSFGTPTGRARIPGATSDAAPEPPAEITPATLLWRRIQLAKASAIAVTAAPRSGPNTADPPRRWFKAISWAETSLAACLPLVERSTSRVRRPAPGDDVADEAELRALGVERADDEHDRRALRLRRDRLAPAPCRLVETHHLGRERAGRGLDAGDRHRLRPACRRRRVGDVDADRAAWTALRRSRLRFRLPPAARRRSARARRAGRRRAGAAAVRDRRQAAPNR